ncbi:MAG: F0F1 ATP synthase subunit epsilon [Acidimicrobiia bacterium]
MPFQVDVVAPEGMVWSGEADLVVARTVEGELGIMADHEPLMASLATGAVAIVRGDDRLEIGVHGGFLQVVENQVTLLTDRAQVAEGGRAEALEVAEELAEQPTFEEGFGAV